MAKQNQSKRLISQHKKSQGVVGIFGDEARLHDITFGKEELNENTNGLLRQYFPKKAVLEE